MLADPVFHSAVSPVTAERLGASWHPGCPVGPDQLRLITATHWDFSGAAVDGELVVHREHAQDLERVLEILFDEGFPIARMQTVDHFGGDDNASMAANNTSAFNCREIARNPGVWSEHAYGAAIDINPVQNPYVPAAGAVQPPAGAEYLDRSQPRQGTIHLGGTVHKAFYSIGWKWGGEWNGTVDYQHFSRTGR